MKSIYNKNIVSRHQLAPGMKFLTVLFFGVLLTGCKKTEPEPLADINVLNGRWTSSNFPVAVTVDFSNKDTTARITAVATNSHYLYKNDVFWRSFTPIGANTFRFSQLTKSRSGYYAFIAAKGTLSSPNQLDIEYSGPTDDTGQLKLDGLKVSFVKE
jgi:hypothetical protein